MKMLRNLCVVVTLMGIAIQLSAETPVEAPADADKAIVITSEDSIEYDFNNHKATATRDVYAVHKDMQLWADRAVAGMDKNNQFRSLVATGHVVIKKGETIATCGQARYDARTGMLVLEQKPVVRQNQNLLEAPIMTWDAVKKIFSTKGHSRTRVILPGQDDPASKALRKHLPSKKK